MNCGAGCALGESAALASERAPVALVTVALPVFNGGHFLELAVRSIQGQTMRDWELLILDDGSQDGAVDRLDVAEDCRIRIVKGRETVGLSIRLNQAVAMARGRYIARMDADDVSFPDRLAEQVAMLESDPALDLVAAGTVTIDSENRILGRYPARVTHQAICAKPWLGFHMPHPSWMGRTAWFRAHPYAEPGPYACEDQDLLLRTYLSSRFACTARVLFAYRLRSPINWAKLYRTRVSLLKCQALEFIATRHWRHAALALAAFALRLGRDGWARAQGRSFHPAATGNVSTEILHEWSQVLRQLSSESSKRR
jgi:glycosyltransferase involved in cell wall biosynthesis